MFVPHVFTDMAGPLTLVDQASVLNPDTPLDVRDVRVEEGGGVRSRGGVEAFTAFAGTESYNSLIYSRAQGNERVIAGDGDLVRAIALDGSSDDVTAALGLDGPFAFARYGAPTAERVYFAQGEDFGYWDGTNFVVNPTVTVDGVGAQASPKPKALAVTPWDNRLVCVGFEPGTLGPDGAPSSGHHVYLSAEGDPDTFTTTHRKLITPGDGEELVAAVAWRERVFLFKQSRFFVLHGTSVDGDIPFFDGYMVDAKFGAGGVRAVCAARDGVYFVGRAGVYRTRGDEPELVSPGLEPLFRGDTPEFFTGSAAATVGLANAAICAVDEEIFVGLETAGGGRIQLVHDPRTGWWGYDSIAPQAMAPVVLSGREQLVYGSPGETRLMRHGEDLVDDDGEDIVALWRSGWHDFEAPGVKRVRETLLYGDGTVALGYGVDLGAIQYGGTVQMSRGADLWGDGTDPDDVWADGGDPSDVWAIGPGYSRGWNRRVPVRGRLWSWQVQGVGPWSVQRVEHHVSARARMPASDVAN